MPHAILAGVPHSLAKRVNAALLGLNAQHWRVSLEPGRDQKFASIDEAQVESLVRAATERGGAHVLGVTERRGQQAVAERIRSHLRFRWFDPAALRAVSSGQATFIEAMQAALAEEDAWREHVMPASKASPLVLPKDVFEAAKEYGAVWDLAESYNKERDFFLQLETKLARFTGTHSKKVKTEAGRYWVDESSRVWKDSGPYHGKAPFPRDWKYSFCLPDGFHFDVSHERGRAFTFRDRQGTTHAVKADSYANVDAHGYKR